VGAVAAAAAVDAQYFDSYSSFDIHQEMLSDKVCYKVCYMCGVLLGSPVWAADAMRCSGGVAATVVHRYAYSVGHLVEKLVLWCTALDVFPGMLGAKVQQFGAVRVAVIVLGLMMVLPLPPQTLLWSSTFPLYGKP
jgi:hypothetical protein